MFRVVVVSWIVVVAATLPSAQAEQKSRIKIGVSTPLTGEASTFRQDVRDILPFDKNGESQDLAFIIKRIHAGKVETIVN